MSQLDYRVITATIASGATTSTEIDLGRSYRKVYLEASGDIDAELGIWAAVKAGGTYRQMYASGATAAIASNITGMFIDLDDYAYSRHMRLVATAAVADGATFNVVCTD